MPIEYANTTENTKLLNETVYLYNKPEIKRLRKEAQIITVVAICILGAGAILCGLKVGSVNGMIASGATAAALGIIGLFCAGYKLKQRYVISPKLLLEYLLESSEVTRTSGDNSQQVRADFRNQLIQKMSSSSYQSFVLFVANKKDFLINMSQVTDFYAILGEVQNYHKENMRWSNIETLHPTFYRAIEDLPIGDAGKNYACLFTKSRKSKGGEHNSEAYFANCIGT